MIRIKKKAFIPLLLLLLGVNQISLGQNYNDITLEQSSKIINIALEKAKQLNVLVNIAIVDKGANLKAFKRMDGSYLGSIDVAIKKAKTARYFNTSTRDLGKLTQPGGVIYNIEHSNRGLITFPGGVPLKDKNGDIIGAIGISGGTIDEDEDIAYFAAKFLLK